MSSSPRLHRRRLSRTDAIGLVIIVALAVVTLYLINQRGAQVASLPETTLPAAIANYAGGSGDYAGRDLNTVPRYPGSRRLYYVEQDTSKGKSFNLIYASADPLKQVSAYYETELPKYGWRLFSKQENALRMDFTRNEAKDVIGTPEVAIQFAVAADNTTTVSIIASEPKTR